MTSCGIQLKPPPARRPARRGSRGGQEGVSYEIAIRIKNYPSLVLAERDEARAELLEARACESDVKELNAQLAA
eukprot:5750810-Pyramimonas_sp.AAC.2